MDKSLLIYLAFLSLKRKNLLLFKECICIDEALSVVDRLKLDLEKKELDFIEENISFYNDNSQIKIITIWDELYPSFLKTISDPPIVLFYMGSVDVLNRMRVVAVVGSRRCTIYGKRISKDIVSALCSCSIAVVSGLAFGVDTAAHRAALSVGGITIGVLGSGLGRIYPKANKDLVEEIIKSEGVVLSEFLPLHSATKYSFPRRNRIISGISEAVIVIEAAKKSGALITAHCALEQGRDVFAVPGPITSPLSYGVNSLIAEGAYPVVSVDDLLVALNLDLNANNSFSDQDDLKEAELDFESREIIKLIQNHNGVTLDMLIDCIKLDHLLLMQKISMLELRGLIYREGNLLCLK